MKLFFGKGKKVEEKIYEYLDYVIQTKDLFYKVIMHYLEGKLKDNFFEESVYSVHFKESKADDLRREIECELYGKALLPEFREDVLNLLEVLDKLPNRCESVLFMISLEGIEVPNEMKEEFKSLIKVNVRSIVQTVDLVKALLSNPENVQKYVLIIDKTESESDKIERKMISELFKKIHIEKADKILLKDLILEIGSISDFAEKISDNVNMINIKTRV